MSNNIEIDSFLEKATILEQTIRDITSGKVDPDTISLKEYGILTPAEEVEEKKRQKQKKEKYLEEEKKRNELEKIKEKKNWWSGASLIYGPKKGPVEKEETTKGCMKEIEEEESTLENKGKHGKRSNFHYYSCDYSRWSDSSYQPDDEATREEENLRQQKIDEDKNTQFEKANQEWCDEFKADMAKRQEISEQREESGEKMRFEGNQSFKQKHYKKALNKYEESLKYSPYQAHTLMNMALCYGKMEKWEESLEFCNRASFVDKSCAKAFYLRSKAHLGLNDLKNATIDLERSKKLFPENIEAKQSYKAIEEEIHVASIEENITNALRKQINHGESVLQERKELVNYSFFSQDSSLEMNNFTLLVHTKKGEKINYKMVQRQCLAVDQCMDLMSIDGFSVELPPYFNSFKESIDPLLLEKKEKLTMYGQFCTKLRNCQVARTYIRTSGYLDNMCKTILINSKCMLENDSDSSFAESKVKREKETACIMAIISEVVRGDLRSKDIVSKSGTIDVALRILCSGDFVGGETYPALILIMGACALISASLDPNFCFSLSILELICKERSIVRSLCRTVTFCSSKDDNLFSHLQTAVFIVKLMSNIANLSKLQRQLFRCQYGGQEYRDSDHPVQSILLLLSSLSKLTDNHITKEFKIQSRGWIVACLASLSSIAELRSSFVSKYAHRNGSSLTAVRVLLAVAKSFKTEGDFTRENALVALSNSMVPARLGHEAFATCPRDETVINIGKEISRCGGINILFLLCTTRSDGQASPSIKHRASSLLEYFAGGGSSEFESPQLQKDQINQLWMEFVKTTVLNDRWESVHLGESLFNDAEASAKFAANLVRIVAKESSKLDWKSDTNYASILVRLLPIPNRDTCGTFTAASISQPPQKLASGSPCSIAFSDQTFHCSILKIIIAYLDSGDHLFRHHSNIVKEGGLERLISLLANSSSSSIHPLTTKNAASALARLVKMSKNSSVMQRARDLRGIEIMLQLSQAGKL